MTVQDLREWIALMESAGELRKVQGADSDIELGVIVDQFQRRMELPAVLFDEIKGYPKGFRVLANTLTSTRRIALTLRLPAESSKMELVQAWRKYAKQYPKIPPRWVSNGPVNENVRKGKDVDLTMFPAPKWHERDGNRYIGTGCLVIQKDPDTNWVNVGVYREAVQVIESETGLPVPATAEIVIEGRIPRDETRDEGPFGEWLGYYASGRRPAPIIKIDAIRYRNNPIIMGNLPATPPNDDTYYR